MAANNFLLLFWEMTKNGINVIKLFGVRARVREES